jgi:hypothetical protein
MTTFVFFVNWLECQSWKSKALGIWHFCNRPTTWITLLTMFLSLASYIVAPKMNQVRNNMKRIDFSKTIPI